VAVVIVKISVVTPVMGWTPWLPLCVRSVADQATSEIGHLEVEHIILNGQPSDEQRVESACAVAMPKRLRNFRREVIHESDRGMYDAINKGFAKSTGEIVAWLNSDEQYLAGALARVARTMLADARCDIVAGDTVLLDEGFRPVAYRKAIVPDYRFIQLAYLNLHSSSLFIRRRWVVGGFPLPTRFRTISDAVWMVELLKAGVQIRLIEHALSCFAFTGSNLGQSALADRELAEWRREIPLGAHAKFYLMTKHYLNEVVAGARMRRSCDLEFFLPHSHQARVRCYARRLSPRFAIHARATRRRHA
jgi:glycosyltransferase involved in cell wall biosynthesis